MSSRSAKPRLFNVQASIPGGERRPPGGAGRGAGETEIGADRSSTTRGRHGTRDRPGEIRGQTTRAKIQDPGGGGIGRKGGDRDDPDRDGQPAGPRGTPRYPQNRRIGDEGIRRPERPDDGRTGGKPGHRTQSDRRQPERTGRGPGTGKKEAGKRRTNRRTRGKDGGGRPTGKTGKRGRSRDDTRQNGGKRTGEGRTEEDRDRGTTGGKHRDGTGEKRREGKGAKKGGGGTKPPNVSPSVQRVRGITPGRPPRKPSTKFTRLSQSPVSPRTTRRCSLRSRPRPNSRPFAVSSSTTARTAPS